MIFIENLSRSYDKGRIKAVQGLNLTINKGELFGFLGPNGAGKTTTIKMMVGLLKPEAGDISFNNISIKTDPVKAKSLVGYVSDEPVLYDKMTGDGFLSFIADIYRVPVKDRQFAYNLGETFEITHALDSVIASYSHGMKQKLAIMSALIHQPDVIILDEPIVGLDPKGAYNLKETLHEYCKKGKTVFFSTHVMEIAEKICHRVGIINKGKLLTADTIEGLRKEAGKKNASLEQMFLEMTVS